MIDPAPAHVGDVQQAVDAAEVDEGAILGEVLHHAFHDGVLVQLGERDLLLLLTLLLEQHPARQDDVPALLVELDDLELELLPDHLLQVAHGAQIDLGAGEEGLDADVDGEAALDATDDGAFDDLVALARGRDLVPHLHLVGLLLGEDAHPGLVLTRLEEHLDLVTFLDGDLTLVGGELRERDLALALEADVDDREVLRDLDDSTLDDLAFLDPLGLLEALLEEGGEILRFHALGLGR